MTATLSKPPARQQRRGDGRVPPHNLEAEASVLGAMLLSADAIGEAIEAGLQHADFYRPAHQHIFDAIRSLYVGGDPVDTVTLAETLRRHGLLEEIGGVEALHELQNATPAISNAAHYARLVVDAAQLRQLLRAASDIAEVAYSSPDDVAQAIDQAESVVFGVGNDRVTDTTRSLSEIVTTALDRIAEAAQHGSAITGAPTGFHDLDELLTGLQPSTLNVVGARPSMGKSSWAMNVATNVAKTRGEPVLFFSLEMSREELAGRILASEARIPSTKLRTGQLTEAEWQRLGHTVTDVDQLPLFLDDNPALTVTEIRAKARRIKARHGALGLIVVDYLQLMSSTDRSENRQLEVSEITRGLKILARELETPIIALSQLSRNVEARSDKRPMLADLRESGSVEQDSDVVMFIFREEVYDPETSARGSAEIIVAKHRGGPIGTRRLVWLDQYTRFENAARHSDPSPTDTGSPL